MEYPSFKIKENFNPIFIIIERVCNKFMIRYKLKKNFIKRFEDDAYQCSIEILTPISILEYSIDNSGVTLEIGSIEWTFKESSAAEVQVFLTMSASILFEIEMFMDKFNELNSLLEEFKSDEQSLPSKLKEVDRSYEHGLSELIAGYPEDKKSEILRIFHL